MDYQKMPKINSKDDLKKYIALRLGAPVATVELEDEQYEIIIDDAIQLLQKYNYGDGSYFEYSLIELQPYKTQYHLRDIDNMITSTGERVSDIFRDPARLKPFVLPEDPKAWENTEVDIEHIFEIKASGNYMGGINSMFTPMHAWWYGGGGDALVGGGMGTSVGGGGGDWGSGNGNSFGNIQSTNAGVVTAGGAGGGVTGSSTAYDPMTPLSNYHWMMQYISSIEFYFQTMFQAIWRPDAGILHVYPAPKRCMNAIMTYYKKENALYLYNNALFKKLVVAMAKMQWGTNLGKFTSDLIGGGSVNFSDIKSEGKEDYQEVMQEIKGESQPADFIWG